MWLCDLEMAVADLKECVPTYLFEKIFPTPYGISFFTTHHTSVFWCRDTRKLVERDENGNVTFISKK
jgi:hypothetical protein